MTTGRDIRQSPGRLAGALVAVGVTGFEPVQDHFHQVTHVHEPVSVGRVEFLPQSELQVMQRRNGLLMDFTVEDGQVTGFKFREIEAMRVD